MNNNKEKEAQHGRKESKRLLRNRALPRKKQGQNHPQVQDEEGGNGATPRHRSEQKTEVEMKITVALLTSKRMWVWLVANVVKVIFLCLGCDLDEQTQELMVDKAMLYGALATQVIEFASLAYTKLLDSKKP